MRPGPGDTFQHDEAVDRIQPGSGPVSVSSWIYGLQPGEWQVRGEMVRSAPGKGQFAARTGQMETVQRAGWSFRRWTITSVPADSVHTRWPAAAPLARIPAVIPGSYPVLFGVGVLVALVTQAWLLGAEEIDVSRSLLVTALALTAGLLGAKAWSAVLHPGESLLGGGWAVDGFLVVAPVVAIVGTLALRLPVGAYIDATTPGLFFAIAIGRIGCFLTGCCAGRVTASRWGIWSSDRRVGARRIPTQLLESATGLFIGLVSLPIVILHTHAVHGAVFVPALALYLAIRQLLLRLRAEPRRFSWDRGSVAHARP